jgi:excisionase family DNA binding protein
MEPKRILLTKEAADILRISEEYLRSLIRQKKIAAYKEGRRGGYRITVGEIDNYITRKINRDETNR